MQKKSKAKLQVGQTKNVHNSNRDLSAYSMCVCVYPFSSEEGLTLFEEHWASK